MFVITVVPLKRGVTIDTLSYFSSIAYNKGTLLTIPIRNASVLGLVTDAQEVSAAKTALRAATFSLRRLPAQTAAHTLSRAYVQTAEDLSMQYAAPVGLVLYNLLPPEIRDGIIPFPHVHNGTVSETHVPYVFQASRKDRFLAYRSLVRETFAHAGSILIVVPSSVEAHEVYDALAQGIQDRTILLSTASTRSELKKAYVALDDFSKTQLIIATPSHAVIERHDITLTIIEHARSGYYKELNRPYLDYRDVLALHARHAGRRIIFADVLPRAEEESGRRNDVYGTYGETPKRIELHGKMEVVDMALNGSTGGTFSLFSETTLNAMREVQKRRGNICVFAARRGIAPLVACMDCGHIFRSRESGAPYSLVRTEKDGVEERWFVCSSSGERVRAYDACTECGSWRLRERGVGVQQVYDELHKQFPGTPIILFDHVTARTYKKALFLRDTFYKTKGAILVGTHIVLPYLTQPVDLSVVANMDALLSTPTWRLEEENLALLLSLREVTDGTVLVQTRTPTAEILNHAKHGTVEHFYTEELELRQMFGYPPNTTFIHFTWQGAPDVVQKMGEEISSLFKNHGISVYANPTAQSDNPIMYGLIRAQPDAWPNTGLAELLRRVHPSVRVMINPDRIV